jgi:hypothetical protein
MMNVVYVVALVHPIIVVTIVVVINAVVAAVEV